MVIKSLNIKGFRNLKPLELKLDPERSVHAFIGANGQGKTNILEAIYLCSLSKSFRTRSAADLVGFEEDFTSIKCEAGDKQLEVVITSKPSQKVLKVNGVKKPAADFVGILKAVFFSPDDLANMSFSPKLRRRYMDVVLTQLQHDCLEALIQYKEACRQRNSLLKKIREGQAKREELEYWDGALAKHGTFIIEARTQLTDKLQGLVSRHYREISDSNDEIQINYLSELRGVKTHDEFLELLRKNHERDVIVGESRLGPHRDDLQFLLNEHDMTYFASRGEWRSLVLALKFAEIDLIKEKTGEDPVLLLDDVFSELDAKRQKYLFKAAGKSQTFVTTTHHEFIEALESMPQVYTVAKGNIV
ncbi:MAG: DNA replication/repair protein RecF [Candidatus Peregrinibacteria bacterium]|nr:DNA replication/repair protein RecF [Candidatus Peregrinibacteria bacterium]